MFRMQLLLQDAEYSVTKGTVGFIIKDVAAMIRLNSTYLVSVYCTRLH